MKLQDLAAKPQLEKVVLDGQDIIDLYGEPLEFWMYDRQDLPTFIKLAQMKEDQVAVYNVIKNLIMDENGTPALKDGEMLPMEVMTAVIVGVVGKLGNLKPQTMTTKAKNLQTG